MKNKIFTFNKYILVITILLHDHNSYAQNHLSGKITGQIDNLPIAGAAIYITDIQRGSISDDKGNYSFSNLPKSILRIQFSAIGFKTLVKTVNLEIMPVLDVSLEPSVTELEEVLVTSNNAKLPDNTPFSANSISRGDLKKYSALSAMANLSYQPGIDKITIGNGVGKPVIRGLSFNQILLYGQGTRIENQQWDDHHDLGLTDIGIENVEIVRGPAAIIYGADALGGALIFTDEKPAATGSTKADGNFGFSSNTLGFNGDFGVKSTSKNGVFFGLRFGGSSNTSYMQGNKDDVNKKAGEVDAFAANSKFKNANFKANAGLSQKWGLSKFSYSYLSQQTGIVEDESEELNGGNRSAENRDRDMEAPYQDVTTQIISVENTIFTGKSKVNFNLAHQVNNRKEFEPLPGKQKELAIGLDLNVTTYDLKWTSNAEKPIGFTIGSQGTFLKNENKGKESLVPNADVSDIAGYGLFRYDQEKINLLGGLRFDLRRIEAETYEHNGGIEEDTFIVIHHAGGGVFTDTIDKPETDFKKDYSPVSFSLGASYHVNEHLTFKLNGATGFSAPNYAQLGTFGKHEGTFRFERGNINFNVEQNLEFDLGAIWENEFITLNLGAYINKIKDYIYIVNTGDTMVRITPDGRDTLPIYDYKQGDATISGFEAGFDIHPGTLPWLDFSVNYSLTKGELDKGGNLPYIPSNKLVSEIKLLKNKLGPLKNCYSSLIVSNYSKQNNITEYELSSDGYTLLDLHIGASVKLGKQDATLEIYCTNLLNTGYFNQLSLVKNIGIRDMGRNIGFSLHLPLFLNNKQ